MKTELLNISACAEPGSRIDDIINKVYAVPQNAISSSDAETRRHSENAANMSGCRLPYNAEEQCLHVELIRRRASWITCLQAWGLLADYRIRDARREP